MTMMPANEQSISMGGQRGPQHMHDLAMAKDEVKARLAPIPVFTVANPKNEFVLVAGEVSFLFARDPSFHAHDIVDGTKHMFCFNHCFLWLAEQHTAWLLFLQAGRC